MISHRHVHHLSTLLVFALLTAGCDEDTITRPPPSNGGPSTVEVLATADREFVETPIHVDVGTTVRWRNDTSLTHTVTPVGHEQWQRAEGGTEGAVIMEHTFTEPGTFEYRCETHTPPLTGNMYGTIHVVE